MFGRATAAYAALSALALALVFFRYVPVRTGDVQDYFELLAESSMIQSRPRIGKRPFEQQRGRVQRDVWTSYQERPVHVCLKSKSSTLSIRNGHVIEELEGFEAQGWDLSSPEALYSVHADRARLVGRDLFLEHNLQIDSPEGQIEAGSAALNKKAICLKTCVKAIATDRLFALSDSLLFFPGEKVIRLMSEFPSRVLFWKEGVAMSAPEVRFCVEDGAAQGIGDVRFSFDEEEIKHLVHGKKP